MDSNLPKVFHIHQFIDYTFGIDTLVVKNINMIPTGSFYDIIVDTTFHDLFSKNHFYDITSHIRKLVNSCVFMGVIKICVHVSDPISINDLRYICCSMYTTLYAKDLHGDFIIYEIVNNLIRDLNISDNIYNEMCLE